MKNLKHSSLLINNAHIRQYFQDYFKEIYFAKDDHEILKLYHQKHPSVMFLFNASEDTKGLDMVKKIRTFDRETVIALLAENIDKEELLEALSLHLAGCLTKPYQSKKVESLLLNVDYELALKYQKNIFLKNGCSFDSDSGVFYDVSQVKVPLTKNEILLIDLLIKNKNSWVKSESIEYYIWGEDSLEYDCSGRLKTLLNGVRKKVKKNTIMNSYGVGYMIATVS